MALLKLNMLGLITPEYAWPDNTKSFARSTLPYEAGMLHCQPVGRSMKWKGKGSTAHYGIASIIAWRWGILGWATLRKLYEMYTLWSQACAFSPEHSMMQSVCVTQFARTLVLQHTMACATCVHHQLAACVRTQRIRRLTAGVTLWFCFFTLFVELQLLILGVDPVLGSDGTIHKKGFGMVFNSHTFTLPAPPCTCHMCCPYSGLSSIYIRTSTNWCTLKCLNIMCCMYCMIDPFVPCKAYYNGPMHRDNY